MVEFEVIPHNVLPKSPSQVLSRQPVEHREADSHGLAAAVVIVRGLLCGGVINLGSRLVLPRGFVENHGLNADED